MRQQVACRRGGHHECTLASRVHFHIVLDPRECRSVPGYQRQLEVPVRCAWLLTAGMRQAPTTQEWPLTLPATQGSPGCLRDALATAAMQPGPTRGPCSWTCSWSNSREWSPVSAHLVLNRAERNENVMRWPRRRVSATTVCDRTQCLPGPRQLSCGSAGRPWQTCTCSSTCPSAGNEVRQRVRGSAAHHWQQP